MIHLLCEQCLSELGHPVPFRKLDAVSKNESLKSPVGFLSQAGHRGSRLLPLPGGRASSFQE